MFIINENCSQKWMIKKCKTFFKVIQNFAIVEIIPNYIFIFTSSFFSFIYGVILKILIDNEKEFHTRSYFSCTLNIRAVSAHPLWSQLDATRGHTTGRRQKTQGHCGGRTLRRPLELPSLLPRGPHRGLCTAFCGHMGSPPPPQVPHPQWAAGQAGTGCREQA